MEAEAEGAPLVHVPRNNLTAKQLVAAAADPAAAVMLISAAWFFCV